MVLFRIVLMHDFSDLECNLRVQSLARLRTAFAIKHRARPLFITDLQNSSMVVNVSDAFVMAGRPPPRTTKIDVVRRIIETDNHVTYMRFGHP
ncbi:hypothetical protein EVAR_94463_1 [Eumeta japonica]|uniref:Uncharacterized protein n=1 Tax=Eumeta variegata TaxID=151549 RepID=A0A4C1ZR97_EUMVA|nr:hypothetical protein EVAR_94463_1 [Eumeta japonica]